MEKNHWKKVESIVDRALALPEEKRTTYIQQECGNDENLIRSVTELMRSIGESEGYLEDPGDQQDELIKDFARELEDFSTQSSMIGERIGAYQVTDLLGHGGMGSVFLAKRVDGAFEHKVALKLVRRGMDTPENIARFQRERAILANLNDPNIARMYDGGLTNDGLPYLIMEYVDGITLEEYCQQHNCSFQQRMDLFKAICRAVQHAHQNLVIHRDLKPSNILVTDDGQVKILDFGIARLLEQEASDQTLFETRPGSNVLTLAYAAPEQISQHSVTTATDIYSLGVLFCELIGGVHPFDIADHSAAEIKKLIEETDPEKPSERAEINASYLQGDLDAIILKMLRKEPGERYSSVGEILEDINRYENQLPVTAHKDSLRYNIGKFAKRHAKPMLVAAAMLIMIAGFTMFYTSNITREHNQARLEAKKAQQVTDFLIQLFDASDPENSSGDQIPVQHLLKAGLAQIDDMSDQPEIKSSLLMIMGEVYRKLNEYEKARSIVKEALKLKQQVHPTPHPDLAEAYMIRAMVEKEIDNFAEAESLYKEGIATLDQLGKKPDSLYAKLVSNLALLYEETGELAEAIPLHKQSIEIQRRLYPPDDRRIGISLNHLALAQKKNGLLSKARANYEQALAILKQSLGDKHPRTVTTTHNLSHLYRELGMIRQAETMMKQALGLRREIYGENHMFVASSLNGMALINKELGSYEQAASNFIDCISILKTVYGDSSLYIGIAGTNLAATYLKMEMMSKADSILHHSMGIIKAKLGPNNAYIGNQQMYYGDYFLQQGNSQEAENRYQQAYTMFSENYPADHPKLATLYRKFGRLKTKQDSLAVAEDYLMKAIDILEEKVTANHWKLAAARLQLGDVLMHMGEQQRATLLLEENITVMQDIRGKKDPLVQSSSRLLVRGK